MSKLPQRRVVLRLLAQADCAAGWYGDVPGVTMNRPIYCRVSSKSEAVVFSSATAAREFAALNFGGGWHYFLESADPGPPLRPVAVPIGMRDRDGHEICLGDVLEFDADEWGEEEEPGERIFTIQIYMGEINHPGVSSDLSDHCRIIGHKPSAVGAEYYS